ncbi:putative leucine-rich repeat receptor-like serine/threonine-protein kinase [Camellia lanceoleosa]|uniref:Leucine-rich repeat receptor-like serine/threonine-protein kinase n=1 Tax=Camellia lanceoleosa TaxID=1840588 RepID=A0ACC0H7D5_9ERIC|nr:putative leucine-rich repeat receptor-like serine/threonine-protein kinase [Camellia lanceoleosa]
MQLVNISLLGNRLTGSIPKEFGNISTLTNLTLEFNQLSGVIPPELGSLPHIQKLFLTSNNFTGELPGTLANLNTLKSFRIGDNSFTGNIPNYIQNWTNLENLVIQGSGLDGPIPPGIAFLTKLSDLRISDLNGTQSTFPPLTNLTNLKVLILRSCNIIGPLPEYLGPMTNLKTLDLSFNKLSGEIPSSFVSLSKTNYIYLTRNLLSGPVPDWILQNGENIDLSYNNFSSLGPSCQRRTVNLFESSSTGNTSGIVSCLRSFQCPQNWYSFHINCGGKEVTLDGNTKYEADTDSVGPSRFFLSGTNWAFSSTGYFLDTSNSDFFICTNTSRLSMKDSDLYVDARLSPISLTYYGFCLLNGSYTVNLHFAEIMFTDDKTYSSLGRRIFDVYIQGKQVLKNFNIENEAGGVGKEIIKSFTALVTDTTLEIRFYWAGKGTTAIPDKGVYGPLISAISVNPDFVPASETRNSISVGAVVGIVAAVVIFLIMLVGILWWRGCLRRKDTMEQDLRGLNLMTGSFTLRQIKAATNNFDAANKIGEGGFGYVYKGLLSDGNLIAVKKLSSKSKQGNREFVNEIGMISALQHPHLVKLYGCCIEGNELLLIYEYMENNSLARALFGPEEFQLNLDWPTRYKICIGIAKGLAFLHEESRIKIVHRDIKSTNVLLDKNLNPKISDFGLAKLDEEDNTHISTRIAGTYGYMAPEYAMHGYLTDKADVYSFGIVALEIVSGKSNTGHRPKEDCFYILDWVLVLKQEGNLMELVDPRLGSDFNKKEVVAMINVALLCINVSPTVRPSMSSVLSMLESRTVTEELVSDSMVSSSKMEPKEMMIELQQSHETNSNDNQIHSMSNDGPWTASTSVADLYPLIIDSDYWANRD